MTVDQTTKSTSQHLPDVAPLPLDLENHVPSLLVWVNNKFAADGSKAYRKMFNVGISDWRVVAYLGVKTEGTASEMSEFLGMDKAAVSRSIATLKDKGYIAAEQPNGRRISLTLTRQGVGLYNAMLKVALRRAEVLLSGFSQTERETLIALMQKMHMNIPHVVETTDALIKDGPSDWPPSGRSR